jgi:hypothetical protein
MYNLNYTPTSGEHKWLATCLLAGSCEIIFSTLKMEAICSSETSVETQQTTPRHIPEYDTLHNHRCENLKSYIHQPVWGYKVEEKLYLGVREQKMLNTTGLVSKEVWNLDQHFTHQYDTQPEVLFEYCCSWIQITRVDIPFLLQLAYSGGSRSVNLSR